MVQHQRRGCPGTGCQLFRSRSHGNRLPYLADGRLMPLPRQHIGAVLYSSMHGSGYSTTPLARADYLPCGYLRFNRALQLRLLYG